MQQSAISVSSSPCSVNKCGPCAPCIQLLDAEGSVGSTHRLMTTGWTQGGAVDWRVYVDGEEPDLGYLRRQLTVPELTALADENGTYLQGTLFDSCASADEVRQVVEPLITKLNGMAGVASPGYRPVAFAGRVKADGSAHLFVSGAARATSYITVTADGFVSTSDGAVVPSGPTPMMVRFLATKSHPVLNEVYQVLGAKPSPNWQEFYKAVELLQEASGGTIYKLSVRTGVSQNCIKNLLATADHPDLSGPDSRHAVMKGTPSARRRLSLDQGRSVVDELIQGFSK